MKRSRIRQRQGDAVTPTTARSLFRPHKVMVVLLFAIFWGVTAVVVVGMTLINIQIMTGDRIMKLDQEWTQSGDAVAAQSFPKTNQVMSRAKQPPVIVSNPSQTHVHHDKPRLVVIGGTVKHTREISNQTWNLLMELSCHHHVTIFMLAGRDPDNYRNRIIQQQQQQQQTFCAPFYIQVTGPKLEYKLPKNRIQRLSKLRDEQRNRIRQLFFQPNHNNNNNNQQQQQQQQQQHHHHHYNNNYYNQSVVMLMDYDMLQFPSANQIMQRVALLQQPDSKISILCALGHAVRKNKSTETLQYLGFYYDLFATIYWPNTFALPRQYRIATTDTDSDAAGPSIEDDGYNSEQHEAYLRQLAAKQQQQQQHYYLAPVRSCFSGLALYRASVWLEPHCQYQLVQPQPPINVMRYASNFAGAPCEHVVFHECLHQHVFGIDPNTGAGENNRLPQHMVIDPDLGTHWLFVE